MTPTINPDKLYRLSEAASLVASSHKLGGLAPETMHRWRLAGRFQAVERKSGSRSYFFIRGDELIRLLAELSAGPPCIPPQPEESADYRAAKLEYEAFKESQKRKAEGRRR